MPYLPNSNQVFYRLWDCQGAKANVVFLHGAGEYSGLYHRFAAAMNAEGYRVWAIDHPGHGFTPGTSEDVYEVSNLVRNAKILLDVVVRNNDQKIVLMGNSLGGVTAGLLMCACDAPSVVGLVLTSTPLEPLQNIDQLDKAIMSLEPTYLDILDSDPMLKQVVPLDYYKLDAGMTKAALEIKDHLPKWNFPVLFINGDNDVLALPEDAKRLSCSAVNGRAVTVRNSHHDILNDVTYNTVARLISNFVFEVTSDDIV